VGAGACARVLAAWFAPSERGFWWALWSSSANVGGFFAPIFVAWVMSALGDWRAGVVIPGALAVAVGLVLAMAITDAPNFLKGKKFDIPAEIVK